MTAASRPVVLRFASAGRGEARCYRVADRLVLCDRAVAALEPFRSAVTPSPPSGPEGWKRRPAAAPVLYADRALVGGHFVAVECHRTSEGFWIDIESAGSFLVTADGGWVVELGRSGVEVPAGCPRPVDAMIGPCLCLALALGGTLVLHASGAVRRSPGARCERDLGVALLGSSGTGKSTLAAALDGRRGEGGAWRRFADDVLPIGLDVEGGVALPFFPQLKLPAPEQWGGNRDSAVPLRALVRLTAAPAGETIRAARLGGRDAAIAILRHTVAGRLFDPELSRSHLDLAARLADRVPVYALGVPRGLATVPDLLAEIERVV